MAYADYNYYSTTYLGSELTSTEFPQLAARASEYIDYYTGNMPARLGDDITTAQTTALKNACCALAERYKTINNARAAASSSTGELASESVGSYSRSYRSGTESAAAAEADLPNVCRRYLANSGLLYRGGLCCVHAAHCDSL